MLCKIRNLALSVRLAVEEMDRSVFPLECQLWHTFPHGACGDTSQLLGKLILDQLAVDCDYVSGSFWVGNGIRTHAWLEHNSYKIDITADQFDGVTEKVIVDQSHKLYNQFRVDYKEKISKCFHEELKESYKILTNHLN